MTVPVIDAVSLGKRFGDFVAVDGITLTVGKGEVFGFLGPNGAGKTTTVKMLCGLLMPSSGSATVAGFDVARRPDDVKSSIGYMSQKFSLYNDLTVSENIDFFGNIYGVDDSTLRARKREILGLVGLEGRGRAMTSSLSVGWKQRLALGCSVIHGPRILFLDEPTAGVDPDSRRMFWDLIYILAQGGMTMFVTTHYMDEAENCKRLGFVYNGRLVAEGTPLEIKRTRMHGTIVEIDTDSPSEALGLIKTLETMEEVSFFGRLIHAVTPSPAGEAGPVIKAVSGLLAKSGIAVRRIDTIPPSLEDIFISLIRQEDTNHGKA